MLLPKILHGRLYMQELQENQGGKVYPLPITSRPLLDTTSASHANIYNRFQAGNVMDELGHEFYKSTGSHQLVKRPTMPELTAVQRYNYERDFAEQKWGRSSREVNHSPSELDNSTLSGLSSSRPHSWPGSCNTMPISQSLGLSGPRYSSTTDMETEPGHVHLVDFLSLPQSSRGVLHGHMGSGPADGLQLDLTMSTGPAAHVDESLSSLPPKNVELDLTLDLSMSSRWRLLSVQASRTCRIGKKLDMWCFFVNKHNVKNLCYSATRTIGSAIVTE